jgi:phosphatidylglycerol---prolipoprotein diacylglyceryl transferase
MHAILFDFGMVQITYYSILILLGVIIGGTLVLSEANRFKIDKEFMANLIFWMVVIGVIGARLYYVLFNWDYYQYNYLEIFKLWEGGLAIHGAMLFGFIFMMIYANRYKVKLIRLTDIIVVGLIIGQAIGRWGNFFNQEAYGSEVSREFLVNLRLPEYIIEGMNIYGKYYHPTFLYESLWCLVGFVVLLLVRKNKYLKLGQVTAIYLMWYSIGRLFIEGMRLDSLMWNSFRVAQLVSAVLFVVGLIIYVQKGRGSRFENLYIEREKTDGIKF